MSRPIKLTQELIDECRQDFEKALSLTKLSDGKLSFTKAFSCGDKKAVVYFSTEAWAKMVMLIKEFDKEVAWHGVARRVEDESLDEYVIDDIVVYPQEVTGSTVEMDTEKYALWIQENIEDERFNHIYMQGHSHVNMGTSPSSVDLNHQEEILGMLGDDDFYIFMIWNKSLASTNKIYDLKKNVMFEDKDITVKIVGQNEGLDEFIKNAKDMVKSKPYVYGGQNGYGGYYNQGYKNTPAGAPYNPLAGKTDDKKDEKKDDKKDNSSGKKNDDEKPRTRIGAGWHGRNACQETMQGWEDEEDYDPYTYLGGK